MSLEEHRQTGRTTRMVAEAVRLAQAGTRVYIIVANSRETFRITEMFPRKLDTHIKVLTLHNPNIDWGNFRMLNAREAAVLVDHYALETRYARVLAELHRFDKVPQ